MRGNASMMVLSRCKKYAQCCCELSNRFIIMFPRQYVDFVFRFIFMRIAFQEEVDDVLMMSMEEILAEAESGGNFTPDSIFACKEYVKLKGSPPTSGARPPVEFSE